jgi:predicted MPP superfamily phosphohydrolase
VLKLVEDARPDLFVSTGDLVDSPYENLREYAEQFARVQAPLGKFGIPGNHEYYVGLDEARRFHRAAGFQFLRGESVDVSDRLRIACADDPTGPFVQTSAMPDPLPGGEEANRPFVLLLKHRPAVRDDSLGRFDLQLSGHTHGGQIFPFNLFVGMVYRYDRGFFDLPKGSQLYVSRGTGTWGPPMRLGSPPEVTLITLEPAGE